MAAEDLNSFALTGAQGSHSMIFDFLQIDQGYQKHLWRFELFEEACLWMTGSLQHSQEYLGQSLFDSFAQLVLENHQFMSGWSSFLFPLPQYDGICY